jgi:predicted O-methyltransferase YrrM
VNANWFAQLATQALAIPPWPDPRFPPSEYYRFLRLLAQNMQPALSVELGLCGGGGSFHLCEGWPAGTVVGVEHAVGSAFEQDNWKAIQERHANFVLWHGDSVDDAPAIAAEHGEPSILFIDTDHTYDQTMREWLAWAPLMAERAVICLDDLFRPGMEEFWDWVPWRKVRLDRMHIGAENGGGFGVAWRP